MRRVRSARCVRCLCSVSLYPLSLLLAASLVADTYARSRSHTRAQIMAALTTPLAKLLGPQLPQVNACVTVIIMGVLGVYLK